MNPSATQQHHARRMMHQMLARASRLPTYSSSYNFNFLPTYPPVAEDDVSIFNLNSRYDVSRFPSKGATLHLIAGGDPCSALAIWPRLQLGVIRPVHRPYPLRPPRGEVRGIFHSSFPPK